MAKLPFRRRAIAEREQGWRSFFFIGTSRSVIWDLLWGAGSWSHHWDTVECRRDVFLWGATSHNVYVSIFHFLRSCWYYIWPPIWDGLVYFIRRILLLRTSCEARLNVERGRTRWRERYKKENLIPLHVTSRERKRQAKYTDRTRCSCFRICVNGFSWQLGSFARLPVCEYALYWIWSYRVCVGLRWGLNCVEGPLQRVSLPFAVFLPSVPHLSRAVKVTRVNGLSSREFV